MHYYKFHIADYRKDTTHLTPIEHYIYRSLIDWHFLDEKPIPKETQAVMRRLRLANPAEEIALNNVLSDFFLATEDGFIHERVTKDIAEYHKMKDKNQINGAKGGRPLGSKTQKKPTGLPDETQAKGNHKPLTNNQEPVITSTNVDGSASKHCPHTEIVDLYHKTLAACPRVKVWNGTRQKHLKTRWHEEPDRQSLEWWGKYFDYVKKSDFLMGRKNGNANRPPFLVDLEWLVKPANLTKIIEGKYHRAS